MKKQNVRTLSLIIGTFTYLLVGAAIFDYLESEYELYVREYVKVETLQLTNKYNITAEDAKLLEKTIVEFVPLKAGNQWDFAGALYFSTTVITTIGYGHSTPSTVGGKVFCMIYALAGIPLGLVMFHSIGERLNTVSAVVLARVKRNLMPRRHFLSSEIAPNHTHLVLIAFSGGTIITTLGAMVFSYYEAWSYFDSLYYCFITLTTIGFGDYVALQQHSHLATNAEYVAFSLIFILFGLIVMSAGMNLLVLRFLTLNTLDEKRDERAAILAARRMVRVDGDIITGGGIVNMHDQSASTTGANRPIDDDDDSASVCSCTCYQLPYTGITHIKASRRRKVEKGEDGENFSQPNRAAAVHGKVEDTSQIMANTAIIVHERNPSVISSPKLQSFVSARFDDFQRRSSSETTVRSLDDFDGNTIML